MRDTAPHINRVSVIENRVLHFADVILPVFRIQRVGRRVEGGGDGRWNETIRKTFPARNMLLYQPFRITGDGLK